MDGQWGQQKNLYFGCYLSKSKEFFYCEMAILFPVKSEMAILFFVKRDPGPPFTTLFCNSTFFLLNKLC